MIYQEHKNIIQDYLSLLSNDISNLLIVCSPAGYGKSTMILESLKKYPENSYLYINNYITPIEFYSLLIATEKLVAPKILALDDIEYSLNNKEFMGLLKSATWESNNRRIVNYLSNFYKTKRLPAVNFTGKIILLLNETPKKNNLFQAIIDRALYYEIRMTNREIIEAMRTEIVKRQYANLPLNIRTKIVDFIERNATDADRISFRTLIKGYQCYLLSPYKWQKLLLNLIKTNN